MQQLTVPRRWLSRASQPINLTIAAAAPLPTVKLINVADGDPVALLEAVATADKYVHSPSRFRGCSNSHESVRESLSTCQC